MSRSQNRPRVASLVGLTLLETLRDQDLPAEFLEDDNPSVTMPRRLGLSDVVERQIAAYRRKARGRARMTDEELKDLIRLVVRRPDAAQVFGKAGRKLAGQAGGGLLPGASRILPNGLAFALARRATRRELKRLFGRRMGGFAHGPYALEGRGLLFLDGDPSGQACQFVTGFCQGIVTRRLGSEYQIVHAQCQSRGDPLCRWTATGEARQRQSDGVREMLLRPELETG